jgi:hypothetical protein
MAARGLKAPDVADAFVIAFGVQPAFSYLQYDESDWQEIARAHNWSYTEDSDGRPGRGNEEGEVIASAQSSLFCLPHQA